MLLGKGKSRASAFLFPYLYTNAIFRSCQLFMKFVPPEKIEEQQEALAQMFSASINQEFSNNVEKASRTKNLKVFLSRLNKINVKNTAESFLRSIWLRGLSLGIKHAEDEIVASTQNPKPSRTIEFAKRKLSTNEIIQKLNNQPTLPGGNRLKLQKQAEVFNTLSTGYTALSPESLFAKEYLEKRNSYSASVIQSQYQKEIRKIVARYVKDNLSEEQTLDKISGKIRENKKNKVNSFLSNIRRKQQNILYTQEEVEKLEGAVEITSDNSKLVKEEAKIQKRLDEIIALSADPQKYTDKIREEEERLDDRLNELDRLLRKPEARISNQKRRIINPNKKVNLTKAEKEQILKYAEIPANSDEGKKFLNKKEYTYTAIEKKIRQVRERQIYNSKNLEGIATRMAVTEVSAAYNLGRIKVYFDQGIRYVQWISTLDSVTSVFCRSLHRKIFPIDEVLASGPGGLVYPKTNKTEFHPVNLSIAKSNDISLFIPPAHPYCRSYLRPILTDKERSKDFVELPGDLDIAGLDINKFLQKKEKALARIGKKIDRDRELKKLLKKQNQSRLKRIEATAKQVQRASTLFRLGTKFLLDKVNSTPGQAKITQEDLKKNDRAIGAALVGTATIMSGAALSYFFLKSNLSDALARYIKDKTTDFFGNSILNNLSNKDKSATINKLIAALSVKPAYKAKDLRIPLEISSPEKIEELALVLDKLEDSNSVTSALSRSGMPIEEIVELTNSEGLLAKPAAKNQRVSETANRLLQSSFGNAKQASEDLYLHLSKGLSNKSQLKETANIFNIDNIKSLTDYGDKGVIGVGLQNGGFTFISRKSYISMIEDKNFQSVVSRYLEETENVQKEFNKSVSSLQKSGALNQNPSLRKEIERQRLGIQSMVSNAKAAEIKLFNLKTKKATNTALDEVLENNLQREEAIRQATNKALSYNKLLDGLADEFYSLLPDDRISIYTIDLIPPSQLTEIKALVDNSIKQIRKKFITGKYIVKPETLLAKKNKNINRLVLDISNLENQIRSNNFSFEVGLDKSRAIYKSTIQQEYERLLELKKALDKK